MRRVHDPAVMPEILCSLTLTEFWPLPLPFARCTHTASGDRKRPSLANAPTLMEVGGTAISASEILETNLEVI